jgi:hypothetical protein
MDDFQVMAPDYEFRTAWTLNDPQLMADAKEFWRELKMLNPAEIERRASELIVVAYNLGKPVAVSTANLAMVEQLRCRCAMYRCAVALDHRRHHLSYQISGRSREVLEQWSLEHPEEEICGMAANIEASQYRSGKQREPMWPEYDLNLNFVGYNNKGQQLRVAWFKHAILPEGRKS